MSVAHPAPNWWERNWKWFVPAAVFVLVLAIGLFVAGVFFAVTSVLKSSDAYQQALQRAGTHTVVTERLGTPITAGFLVLGNIQVSGTSGEAELSIPIRGPKGTGTVHLEATKTAGLWMFEKLVAEIDSLERERIDLLAPAH